MIHVIWDLMTIEFVVVTCIAILFGVWVGFYAAKPRSLKGKHVMITGGSSGIGKYLAIECAKNGAHISLVSRNPTLLEEARVEVLKFASVAEQKVSCFSVDVSGPYDQIERTVLQAEEELGPLFLLANCAGYARAARFEDTSVEEIKRLMAVNYFGAAQFSHAVISGMKGRREGGIVFVSSQGGLCGIYGFAAYAASKFALRGLAESLAMELKPYNLTVTVSFPPDTDTPGFAEENKNKPEETRLISETAGLFSPETVAKVLLDHSLKGKFISTVGFEGFLQSVVCIGMAPITSVFDLLVQSFTMGIFRLISSFYLFKFDRIVVKCMENRDLKKRSQ
ncbi:3-ketodihydrosphingosine reductase-like [Daphnia pulex]|uniref:3-ketodihydrosphingosine reductase-like n=1 Tax=Daphnia pulex TaxID=6669 RepID=UPI001EDF1E15|nr:3-ketodihydrosphingosine reductase-like [Daphnia pulex]XP_046650165.1 3-ketodihydrosphingosine reductase-like [Daphnia pulicaria]